VAGTDRRQS